jgi:hypothetical protein
MEWAVARPGRRVSRTWQGWLLPAGLISVFVIAVLQASRSHNGTGGLAIVLYCSAVVAGLAVAPSVGRSSVSASFLVIALAATFLGPTPAAGCALLAEVAAALKLKTAPFAIAFNLLGAMAPALVAANTVRALIPHPHDSVALYLVVALAGVIVLTLNFAIVASYQGFYRG